MKTAIVFPKYLSFKERVLNNALNRFPHFIPHGIAYIIKYADLHGENVDFIDLERMSWKKFKNIIKDYDLVGYSILSNDYYNGIKAISFNKKMNKNVSIVVGGVDPSTDTDKYLKNPNIDHIIIGEGEISFLKTIKSKKHSVDNSGSEKNSEDLERLIYGEKIEDLDSLGFIDRDLFPQEHFMNPMFEERFFTIMVGRTCLYNCNFCQPASKIMFGSKLCVRSPEHVVKELNYLKKEYGLKSFYFWDDNILQNREWIAKFIECCKFTKFKGIFTMRGRSNNIIKNKDLINDLYEIGLRDIFIGLESGSEKMLKCFNKGTSVELNEEALSILNKYEIHVSGSFIFGFPFETKEDIKLTEKFIKNNVISYLELNTFVPYPGTHFTKKYKEKDLLFESENVDVSLYKPKLKGVNYYYIAWFMFKMKFQYQYSYKFPNGHEFNNLKFKISEFLVLIYHFLGISVFYIHNFLKVRR